MKDVFQMKVITYTITHQKKKTDIDTHTIMYQANFAGRYIESKMYPANFAGGHIESKMYPANFAGRQIESKMYPAKFAGGRSRLDLLLPSFLPSREEKKIQDRIFCPLRGHSVGRMQYAPTTCQQETLFLINSLKERIETKMQDRIFCPLRGHAVGRMQYAPTSCRQETLFPINSRKERTETKMQDQKNRPLGCRGVSNTPSKHLGRDEQKMQDRIFCPLRGHSVGRMLLRPTTCRQETLFPINSREERTETKMQERRKQSIDSGAEWHTPFMRQGERDAVWRDTFLEQRARVAIWRDRRLEEKYSHARFQLSTFGENSKPYKSSLVALSEQLRDIFAA